MRNRDTATNAQLGTPRSDGRFDELRTVTLELNEDPASAQSVCLPVKIHADVIALAKFDVTYWHLHNASVLCNRSQFSAALITTSCDLRSRPAPVTKPSWIFTNA